VLPPWWDPDPDGGDGGDGADGFAPVPFDPAGLGLRSVVHCGDTVVNGSGLRENWPCWVTCEVERNVVRVRAGVVTETVPGAEATPTVTPTLCADGSDWCCYWDFSESDGGWEAYGGTWDGSAWVGWNFYDGSWMAIWEGYSSIGAGAEWVIEQVEVWGSGYPPQTWEDGLALSIAPLGGGGGQVFDYKDFSGYYGWSGAFPVDGGKEGKFRIDLRDDDTGGQMHSISAVYAAGSGPDPGLCDVMSSPPVTSSEEITQMQGGVRFVWGGEGTPDVVTPTDYLIRLDISGIADAEPFWFLPDSGGWLDGCTDGSPITSTFVEESYEFMSPSVQRYVFDLPTLLECGIALWSEIDMSEGEGSGTFVGAGPVRDEYMLEWEFSSDGGETWTDSPDDASGAPDPPWEIEPVFEQCFTFPGAWHVDTGPFTRTIDFGDMTSLEQREFCARVDGITFTDEFAVFNAPAAAAFISLLVAAALGIVRS
jgi:hypothetical protein